MNHRPPRRVRSKRWCRSGALWLVWFFCVLQALGQGGEYLADPYLPPDEIDELHRRISERIIYTARTIDNFFGDDRIFEEDNETHIRVTSMIRYENIKDLTFKLSLSGQLQMPYLQDRLQFFASTDGRERDVRDSLQQTPNVTDDDKSIFTGLRYVTRETSRSRISIDGGLRWRGGPVPLLRLRGRRTFVYDNWAIRFVQTFFWVEDRGFGQQTRLDFERKMDDQHFVRITPSIIWSEISEGVDWRQIFSVVHIMNADNMIATEVDVQGHTWPSSVVDKIEGYIRWRHRTGREWMFFEVTPGLAFRRENDYQVDAIIAFKVEVLFGDPTFW
jgi:hypothetical protein